MEQLALDKAQHDTARGTQVGMRAKEYLDLANNMHLFDDGTLESLRSVRPPTVAHDGVHQWPHSLPPSPHARLPAGSAAKGRACARVLRGQPAPNQATCEGHACVRACVRAFLS